MKLDPFLLIERAASVQSPAVAGRWQSISIKPDFASGERLNVGVLLRLETGTHFRLLEDFDKFVRLYGPEAEDELRFLLRILRGTLSEGGTAPDFPSISFGPSKVASGSSAADILDRLFVDTVSLRGSAYVPKQAVAVRPNNTAIRQHVFDFMRQQAGIEADRLIASDVDLLFRSGTEYYPLDVPIRFRDRVGTIASACFATPEAVERSLLRCYLDLATAAHLSHAKTSALYVCRPKERTSQRSKQIDNVIGLTEWKVKRLDCNFRVLSTPEQIAADVLNWAHA